MGGKKLVEGEVVGLMTAETFSLLLGADSLLGRRSGVGRMTLEIARQLEGRSEIDAYGLLVAGKVESQSWLETAEAPDDCSDASCHISPPPSRTRQFVTEMSVFRQLRDRVRRTELWRATRQLRAGTRGPVLYHEPNMITSPYDGPTVATFNDLSWHWNAEFHPAERVAWIERNLPRVLSETTRFVAISQFTAAEMVRELSINRQQIDVVPLAPAPEFRPLSREAARGVLARYDLQDQSYILSVSTREPRKNFDRLFAAYRSLPAELRRRTPLIIAGGKGWGDVLSEGDSAIASGELRLIGHVSDADLVALTARCGVFAYVSLYEGFGLPVVEAMATGAPVVASATTATGETGGNGALCVDPLDEEAIAAALRLMLEDESSRIKWRAAGVNRAAQFTWSRTVDHLVSSWRRALREEAPVLGPVLQPVQIRH